MSLVGVVAPPASAQYPGRNGAITSVNECVLSGPVGLPEIYCWKGGYWNPTGRLLAGIIDPGNGIGDLYIWDEVSKTLRWIGTADVDSKASFSPDSRELAIGRGGDIVVVSVATGQTLRVLTPNLPSTVERDPSWNPRNTAIAYTASDGVRARNPGGGKSWLIKAGATFADYAPDGNRIGYLQNGRLHDANPDGSAARMVPIQQTTCWPPASTPYCNYTWSPGEFTWSPDGRSFLIQDPNEGDLMITTLAGQVLQRWGGSGESGISWRPLPDVPGVPGSVRATAGDGAAAVSWGAPASDGGSPITGYEAQVSPGPPGVCVTPPGLLTCTFYGLTNGVGYSFRVRAINDVGRSGWSVWSDVVTPSKTEPAAVPTRLSITRGALVVPYGGHTRIIGQLSLRDTYVPQPGQLVELWGRRLSATTWSRVGVGQTNSVGAVGFVVTPTVHAAYQVRFPGTLTILPAASGAVSVLSRSNLVATGPTGRVTTGNRVRFTARINPLDRGQLVTLQRWNGQRWRAVTSATVRGYPLVGLSTRIGQAGRYSFRIVLSRTTDHLGVVSGTIRVRIT